MSLPDHVWQLVRERANFACEYCGVCETDAGATLTVDHFQPVSRGGNDEPANLVYACPRCNDHKGAWWSPGSSRSLWNPRQGPASEHLLKLADGRLIGLTPTGIVTIKLLRLNRPELIAHRLKTLRARDDQRQLEQRRAVENSLAEIYHQQVMLAEEQRALLERQLELLHLLSTQRRADDAGLA